MIYSVNDFFDDFDSLRNHAISLDYKGEVNPLDGVFYPDVSTDVPDPWFWFLCEYLNAENPFAFFRLTTNGTSEAPHQAHNDSLMGKNTALIYINEGVGGTSILKHKEAGLTMGVETQEELNIWRRDMNNYDAWDILEMIDLEPNKLIFYPSYLMHRAEPVGGFGDNPINGRLVLTMFYD